MLYRKPSIIGLNVLEPEIHAGRQAMERVVGKGELWSLNVFLEGRDQSEGKALGQIRVRTIDLECGEEKEWQWGDELHR